MRNSHNPRLLVITKQRNALSFLFSFCRKWRKNGRNSRAATGHKSGINCKSGSEAGRAQTECGAEGTLESQQFPIRQNTTGIKLRFLSFIFLEKRLTVQEQMPSQNVNSLLISVIDSNVFSSDECRFTSSFEILFTKNVKNALYCYYFLSIQGLCLDPKRETGDSRWHRRSASGHFPRLPENRHSSSVSGKFKLPLQNSIKKRLF